MWFRACVWKWRGSLSLSVCDTSRGDPVPLTGRCRLEPKTQDDGAEDTMGRFFARGLCADTPRYAAGYII